MPRARCGEGAQGFHARQARHFPSVTNPEAVRTHPFLFFSSDCCFFMEVSYMGKTDEIISHWPLVQPPAPLPPP